MTTKIVLAEIGEEDKPKALDNIKLVSDLWIDLVVAVMMRMYLGEKRVVESEVKDEEKRIIYEKAGHELDDELSAFPAQRHMPSIYAAKLLDEGEVENE
ncbi:MAG: hypothetical protein LQ352_001743 [Teloschistes flavicans]|nr:MAG: hypothetical protein LQ352_001743 [Teloschistes flavicans]